MKSLLMILSLALSLPTIARDVDTKKSEFQWTATKVTGKHFGKIPLKKASLKEKKGQIIGGEFVMDISNFSVDDLKGEWKTKFLGHIKSKDFFEVSKWPTAKIIIEKLDGKIAHGKMTIRDKTHPVKISYLRKGNIFSGTLKFDRTRYGMVYGSGNFFKNLGDKMIHNDVKIDFNIQLK